MSETVDLAKLAEEMVACLKADPTFAAELISGCLAGGNPTVLANAIRAIMRAEGEEGLTEPTLADFLAITKRFGLTVRADSDSWGIGPYPDREEFERRFNDPRFTISTLEHEGYIAVLEVDVDACLIRGRFVNEESFPDFFAQTVEQAKVAFGAVVQREKEVAASSGYSLERPGRTKAPRLLPKQFDEWFPELSKGSTNPAGALRYLDILVKQMRVNGLLDEYTSEESRKFTTDDYRDAMSYISHFFGNFAPMPTKMGWVIRRLSDELSLVAAGGQPQFLRPAVYGGTKSGSPKYSELRKWCACTVASLMRRGESRDNACKAVANLLREMSISTKKNGEHISQRTVLSFYDAVRRKAEKQGKVVFDPDHILCDANIFLVSLEADLEECDPIGKGRNYPEENGQTPLENLRFRLDLLSPIV